MEIRFRNNALKSAYKDHRKAEKLYGKDVARKYIQRVNLLKHALNLNEVMVLPGLRCHKLKGDRATQYAIWLTVRYRLIFTVSGRALEIATIEEVSKHYDD